MAAAAARRQGAATTCTSSRTLSATKGRLRDAERAAHQLAFDIAAGLRGMSLRPGHRVIASPRAGADRIA
jgi:hypothetical protein